MLLKVFNVLEIGRVYLHSKSQSAFRKFLILPLICF